MSQILLTFTVVIALIVAAVLGATVILFIGWVLGLILPMLWARLQSNVASTLGGLAATADEKNRMRQMEEEIAEHILGKSGMKVDPKIIRAKEQTEVVAAGTKTTGNGAVVCFHAHLVTARLQGVTDMSEIASDPLLRSLRQRVVDSMGFTIRAIEDPPYFLR